MLAQRYKPLFLLIAVAFLYLTGFPAWIHFSEVDGDHDGDHCSQCLDLLSSSALEPGQAVGLIARISPEIRASIEASRILPMARLRRLPPCRAPPQSF